MANSAFLPMQIKYGQVFLLFTIAFFAFVKSAFAQIQPGETRRHAQALSDSGQFISASAKYAELYRYWKDENVLDSAYFYKYKELHHLGLSGANKECTDQLIELVAVFDQTSQYPRFASHIYYTIGSNFLYQNEFDKALEFLERSMVFEQKQHDADTLYIAKAMEWKGLTNIYAGDMAKAAELVESAVTLHVKALGSNHKELGYTLNSLALIYDELNMLEKADSTFSEALRILRQHLPPEHSHISTVLANISSIKVELGDFEGARSMLESAIEIHR
ncbi:MAG TPA: tetratricopeptide repeat protein, partial [Cryomorphaceae bacterium]|nr:tetratricopeptide repeat protein [Cryomorphaceae bacterium]